ncbi:MAG: hypothetical protein GQ540_10710 [Lutibacter sp.]|uniref:hypothetical protein n=1 Tax=Lutibacter sp. TaxID=1925666 RepID=UPI0019E65FFE|nr:hypothetical protein [Lutibacter sp.]NOR28984.1 hypothetical protein [Lutibacter sp.]
MHLSIFSDVHIIHLIEIFCWMLGTFLIGLYFGRFSKTTKKGNKSVDFYTHEELNLNDDISKIRATKTFERGGKEMIKTVPVDTHEGLNFSRIGIATLQNKDDLQLIKGIGTSIEKNLNNIEIFTFKQISNFNSKDIVKVTELIKFFPGRIERDDWVGQAFSLLNNDE